MYATFWFDLPNSTYLRVLTRSLGCLLKSELAPFKSELAPFKSELAPLQIDKILKIGITGVQIKKLQI